MFKIKTLKNFAVIKTIQDQIELNDLTIFMGDNSAGKSYLAMLIHSFITMSRGYDDKDFLKAILSKFSETKLLKDIKESIETVFNEDNKNNNILIIFEEDTLINLQDIIKFAVNEYLIKKYLVEKLFQSYNLGEIEVELAQLLKKLPKQLSISNNVTENRNMIEIGIDKRLALLNFQGASSSILKKETLNILIAQLLESTIKGTLPLNSVYLPASRTGYLQTYKTLANKAVIKGYSSADEKEDSKLSIIISYFITQLNSNTAFKANKFSDYIESFIMNGKVNIYKDSSDIDFELATGDKIDLNYLSSTVSELIPLVVFLKRGLIKKNGLLVIEEPEAHLSFKNQKLIAKLIALLLENDIKVLITTHSDFLIYELNNLIMKNTLLKSKKEIDKALVEDKISLDYKKVALYNFELDGQKSVVTRVPIDKYGINNNYIFESTYSLTETKNKLLDAMDSIDA